MNRRWAAVVGAISVVGACGRSATTVADVSDVRSLAEIEGLSVGDDVLTDAGVDVQVQRALAAAFDAHVPDTGGRFIAAAVVVEVDSGRIVAYDTSGTGRGELLDQQRPSGSTLKLVVDVALADAGVIAEDGVFVIDCVFPDGVSAPASTTDAVISIRAATAVSSNCAFGKLTRAVGPERLDTVARSLGFARDLDLSTDFGFGANSVSLRELVTAAAITVGDGNLREIGLGPSWRSVGPSAGLPVDVGSTVSRMSSGVVEAGGTAAGNSLPGRHVIAKTGTTQGSTDAWIVGGTVDYVAAVWMGNPERSDDGMSGGAVPGVDSVHGGDLPARIWHDVLVAAHRGIPEERATVRSPARDIVIVVDPTVDCTALADEVHPPASDSLGVPWIESAGVVRC